MSTRRDPEQDLQQLLNADRGDLGHIYDKLARAEPPPRLDRIVLGEAARAPYYCRDRLPAPLLVGE